MELVLALAEHEDGRTAQCAKCEQTLDFPLVVGFYHEGQLHGHLVPFCDECIILMAAMMKGLAVGADKLRAKVREGQAPPPPGTTKH